MKLQIVNPTAPSFHASVGISEERSNELGAQMDKIVDKYFGAGPVRVCDLIAEITELANNTEELAFCLISHCNYMTVKHRLVYCPPKDKPKVKPTDN